MTPKYLIIGILLIITACTITGESTIELVQETTQTPIQTYFCERDNCEQQMTDAIASSQKTNCALYSLNSEAIKTTLRDKNAGLVIEQDNKNDFAGIKKIKMDNNGLMHNKFCIIDSNKIITGSWNPAEHTKTANNMLIIQSTYLAQNYEAEFEEMQRGVFKKGEATKYPRIMRDGKLIENYFCPEDKCTGHVIEALNNAKESIYFMTYSFTDDDIGDVVLKKANTLNVKGVFDSSQLSEWSQYDELRDFSAVKKGVHHKVFIIDNATVITGSYNPTKNGNTANDENLLIIHDKDIAEKFLEEFNLIVAG